MIFAGGGSVKAVQNVYYKQLVIREHQKKFWIRSPKKHPLSWVFFVLQTGDSPISLSLVLQEVLAPFLARQNNQQM